MVTPLFRAKVGNNHGKLSTWDGELS